MIRFGPSGNSDSFYAEGYKFSEQAPKWLAEKGLSAYEYSFGRGVSVTDRKAIVIGKEAAEYDIAVSVHAPYYINLANPDGEMADKSFGYILRSADKVRLMGGNRIVFHPASVGKATREDAFKLTVERMHRLADLIHTEGYDDLVFCPETMGKINQIGTLDEVIELCLIDDIFVPTVDFGHLNARTMGGMNSYDAFKSAFDRLSVLGGRASEIHIHFSKIEYSKGGEVRHLTLADNAYGPEFEPLARVIREYGCQPTVLSESDGTQCEDAVRMKQIYEQTEIL